MSIKERARPTTLFAAALLALVVGQIGSALAAPSTGARRGVGTGELSGYVVSAVHFELDPVESNEIHSVRFEIDGRPSPGTSIRIKLSESSGWTPCNAMGYDGVRGRTAVSCAMSGSPVIGATALTVLIAP